MKVRLLCNGWIPPFNITSTLGNPRESININTRLEATINATPEQQEAIRDGISKGWRPEFWIIEEVKE